MITPTQLLLTSRGVGTTDLSLWKARRALVIALTVTATSPLRFAADRVFPHREDPVSAAGDLIVCRARSRTSSFRRAARCPLMREDRHLIPSSSPQCSLEVKFAEVSRNGLLHLGLTFFAGSGGLLVDGMSAP